MRPQDRAGFANALVQTAVTLGTEKPGEQRLRAYWEALEAYPLDMIEGALKVAGKTETFFPVPAKIIELIGFVHEDHDRAEEVDKVAEWRRDRELHPEEYYLPHEIPGVLRELAK